MTFEEKKNLASVHPLFLDYCKILNPWKKDKDQRQSARKFLVAHNIIESEQGFDETACAWTAAAFRFFLQVAPIWSKEDAS